MRGAGGFPRDGDAELVLELYDDSLRRFFANPLGLREQTGVARDYGRLEVRHCGAAEDIERGFGPDPGDVLHEQPEEIPFGTAHETEEDVRVFTDLEMR